MKALTTALLLLVDLTKAQATVSRRMEAGLSVHGLGFTDFILLLHLYQSPAKKMRRIDLADAVGVTASGVTRMLAPLEKNGLVGRESNERDARVSYVVLTAIGEQRLQEALTAAEAKAMDLLPAVDEQTKKDVRQILRSISG